MYTLKIQYSNQIQQALFLIILWSKYPWSLLTGRQFYVKKPTPTLIYIALL